MLQRLVLKNAADCTSQRVKRTSGARVVFFLCFNSDWKSERYELLVVVGCWLLVVGCLSNLSYL